MGFGLCLAGTTASIAWAVMTTHRTYINSYKGFCEPNALCPPVQVTSTARASGWQIDHAAVFTTTAVVAADLSLIGLSRRKS